MPELKYAKDLQGEYDKYCGSEWLAYEAQLIRQLIERIDALTGQVERWQEWQHKMMTILGMNGTESFTDMVVAQRLVDANAALEAKVARLEAPVRLEEWNQARAKGKEPYAVADYGTIAVTNRIIAARAGGANAESR